MSREFDELAPWLEEQVELLHERGKCCQKLTYLYALVPTPNNADEIESEIKIKVKQLGENYKKLIAIDDVLELHAHSDSLTGQEKKLLAAVLAWGKALRERNQSNFTQESVPVTGEGEKACESIDEVLESNDEACESTREAVGVLNETRANNETAVRMLIRPLSQVGGWVNERISGGMSFAATFARVFGRLPPREVPVNVAFRIVQPEEELAFVYEYFSCVAENLISIAFLQGDVWEEAKCVYQVKKVNFLFDKVVALLDGSSGLSDKPYPDWLQMMGWEFVPLNNADLNDKRILLKQFLLRCVKFLEITGLPNKNYILEMAVVLLVKIKKEQAWLNEVGGRIDWGNVSGLLLACLLHAYSFLDDVPVYCRSWTLFFKLSDKIKKLDQGLLRVSIIKTAEENSFWLSETDLNQAIILSDEVDKQFPVGRREKIEKDPTFFGYTFLNLGELCYERWNTLAGTKKVESKLLRRRAEFYSVMLSGRGIGMGKIKLEAEILSAARTRVFVGKKIINAGGVGKSASAVMTVPPPPPVNLRYANPPVVEAAAVRLVQPPSSASVVQGVVATAVAEPAVVADREKEKGNERGEKRPIQALGFFASPAKLQSDANQLQTVPTPALNVWSLLLPTVESVNVLTPFEFLEESPSRRQCCRS
ncbi:MAG: hypothetical protein HY939_07565 [Gammaproteobacteria bacterium]|nr:hypothetical protein [Gammaproteobacteria bacterium]